MDAELTKICFYEADNEIQKKPHENVRLFVWLPLLFKDAAQLSLFVTLVYLFLR